MQSSQNKKILIAISVMILSSILIWLTRHPSHNQNTSIVHPGVQVPTDNNSTSLEKSLKPNAAGVAPQSVSGQVSEMTRSPDAAGSQANSKNIASGAVAPNATGSALSPSASKSSPAEAQTVRHPDGCFTVTFHHDKIASHSDGEQCLNHQNLFTLQHPDQPPASPINPDSVCVRVNGNVVKHQWVAGKLGQVIIGPEAGPRAKVSVRYCTGKSTCAEKCPYKGDEFLQALGAGSGDSQQVGWDGSKGANQEDSEVESEMKALNEERNSVPEAAQTIFKGWTAEDYALACTHKLAHTP